MPTRSAARARRAAADAIDRKTSPPRPASPSTDAYAGGPFAPPPANNAGDVRGGGVRGGRSPGHDFAGGSGANTPPPDNDVPFEVRGFATDPKHSGYQILTNYESTYWRAFVGVQAWALYEVLRSFCHNGNNVCYPSINYLLEVLGIKQRRVLTGWSTTVKGKNYDYPGLIEILQNGGLVIAEVVGEGPMQRYLFHVNLTPDLLRPEQVAELPPLLQSKHAEMLQAHYAEMAELASRRRPAKVDAQPAGAATQSSTQTSDARPRQTSPKAPQKPQLPLDTLQNDEESTKNMVESGGVTNCHRGMTNCHTPSDNLSYKQHQYNNTQLTSASATRSINNNSGEKQQELLDLTTLDTELDASTDVVVALLDLGLADNVVKRLTTRFNRNRILEKIDYLAYLERYHPNKVKNPRGWLRRAIEENYGPPDGYLPPEARAAQQDAPANDPRKDTTPRGSYAAYVDRDEIAASQAAQATAAAEREYQRAARRELVRRHYAPDAATLAFWEMVQNDVRYTMSPEHYQLIAEASILWMENVHTEGATEGTVAVAIWDREHYRTLLHPNRVKALTRTMSTLARRQITMICEFWDEEGRVVPPGTPPPDEG